MVDIKFNWAKVFRAIELGVVFGAVNFIFSGHGALSITLALAIMYIEFFFKQ